MPTIDVISACKTFCNPTGELPFKESTISGTLDIINDIYRKYLGLDDEFYFKEGNENGSLYLVYGDQLTVQKVRVCQQRRVEEKDVFENLKWILLIPALFHLQMVTVQLINETHYGSESGSITDRFKLRWAKEALNRERVKLGKGNNDFFPLEQFLKHSFQARITATFAALLKREGKAKDLEEVRKTLEEMPVKGLRFWAETIVKRLFRTFTFNNKLDDQYCNHLLFCQQWMIYVTLKHGIKHGDIGMLRQSFSQLAVLFNGFGKHNYAHETLYLHWLTNTGVADKELQHAILVGSLVNLRGQHDSWFLIDLSQEMQNLFVKELITHKRTSSVTSEHLFNYCSLNSTHVKERLLALERLYAVKRNTKQASKSAEDDIHKLCETLRHEVLERQLRKSAQSSRDLMSLGVETLLQSGGAKFNKRQCGNSYIITDNDVQEDSGVLDYISKDKDDREDVDIRDIVVVDLKTSDLSEVYDCNEGDEDDNDMINSMY